MNNETGEIRGKVIDEFVKRPLSFAKVSVTPSRTVTGGEEAEIEVTCNENGEYVISKTPIGSYTVKASMAGYVSEYQNIRVSEDTPTTVDFSLTPVGFFDLKEKVPYYTKFSFLIALIALIVACLFIPTTEPKPYKRKVDVAIRAIELPPQLKQLEEPPPPPKPEMPVAAESEAEVEAETIERTDFSGIEKAPPKPKTEDVYEYWAVEVKPVLLQKYDVKPEYPEFARKAEIEGQVVVKLLVDTTGRVIDITVLKSVHELLDAAAVKAAAQWRFSPAKQRDKPVRVWVVRPVTFSLEQE